MLSYDERTETTSYQPVMAVIQGEQRYQIIKITLDSGESIETTAEHHFYIKGKGWNPANSLKVGQALQLHNGTTVVVKEVDTSVRVERVYNLTVANTHNYFVGGDGVLVHNADKCEKIRGLWQITKGGTEKVVQHSKFGKIYKSKSDGLWWSKDTAGHGGSQWKVFKETEKGLEWIADADEYGDFIVGKYKGDVGKFIPWKQLKGKSF